MALYRNHAGSREGDGGDMTEITDAQREALKVDLDFLSKSESAILAARAPFDVALSAVEAVRGTLLERHGVEVAGACESCGKLLFVGELGHDEPEVGIVLCPAHAPTYAVWKQQTDQGPEAYHEPEDFEAAKAAVAGHIAAGGSLDDKIPLFPL